MCVENNNYLSLCIDSRYYPRQTSDSWKFCSYRGQNHYRARNELRELSPAPGTLYYLYRPLLSELPRHLACSPHRVRLPISASILLLFFISIFEFISTNVPNGGTIII